MTRREEESSAEGRLVLVATPLGHRGDLSPRARATIAAADQLLCEDTRSVTRLFGDDDQPLPPRTSCFAANEAARIPLLLDALARGETVVYISEAGMPGWSDPGSVLVCAAVEAGYAVDIVPGPCAAVSAMAISGFSAKDAVFVGFLPRSGARRKRALRAMASRDGASMVYESGQRVSGFIRDFTAAAGDATEPSLAERPIVLARELTKLHQEVIRGSLGELQRAIDGPLRGELTIVVQGRHEFRSRRGEADLESESAALPEAADTKVGSETMMRILDIMTDEKLKPRQKAKLLEAMSELDARSIYGTMTRARD